MIAVWVSRPIENNLKGISQTFRIRRQTTEYTSSTIQYYFNFYEETGDIVNRPTTATSEKAKKGR